MKLCTSSNARNLASNTYLKPGVKFAVYWYSPNAIDVLIFADQLKSGCILSCGKLVNFLTGE